MDKYLYKLVVFDDVSDDPNELISIEIVPSSWIVWDEETGTLWCKYMSGVLTEKKKKELQRLVKECKPANSKWAKYRVDIRGRAKTYEDAEIGIHQLENKKYAYSTDDEIKCLIKAQEEKKYYQIKKISSNSESVEARLNSARIDLTNDTGKSDHFEKDSISSYKSSSDTSIDKNSSEEKIWKKTHLSKSKQKIINPHELSSSLKLHEESPRKFFKIKRTTDNEYRRSSETYSINKKLRKGVVTKHLNQKENAISMKSKKDAKGDFFNKQSATSNVFNEKRITFSDSQSDKLDSSKSSSESSKSIFKTKKSEVSELSMVCEEELDDENATLKDLFLKYNRSLSKQISDLKGMIVHNGIKISQLRDSLQNIPTRIIESDETDEENDQNVIKLPCPTLEIFDMFEQRLQTDITYRNKIKQKVRKSADKHRDMTRCLGNNIRKYMSQAVGEHFVPVKATTGKRVFKDTALYVILEDIYTQVFGSKDNPVSTKKFQQAVQGVLHNTKDWGGKRRDANVKNKTSNE